MNSPQEHLDMLKDIASLLGLGRDAPLSEIVPAMYARLMKSNFTEPPREPDHHSTEPYRGF